MEDNISLFCGITSASPTVARGFLEITAGNFERAIELFYENPDLVSGIGGLSHNAGASSSTSRPGLRVNFPREDANGVIHIPSDDEDADMGAYDEGFGLDDDDLDQRAVAAQAAALAQEEEDAAMAKRLQEELYQESASHDVRAPIARTTETLVGPDASWGVEDNSTILEQLRRRRQPPTRSVGPFGQRIWGGEDGGPSNAAASSSENGPHVRRLEDLFRPPYDLMARLSWDEARALGKEDKKWIMVNLQDMSDFNCQTLNRDLWKDKAVRELVLENFIFLQYDKDYPDAEEFITFYFPNRGHENQDNYPHVSIIDPRTGEQVKVWSGRPFPDAIHFHAELAEFLDRYSLAANSKNPVAQTAARKHQVIDVDRMTEEEMLEMALKNSLAGAQSSGSGSTLSVHDPDALTKVPEASEEETGISESHSPFAQISSSNPHVEPDNNPATTTRIQFRHPNGRIIRRFNLQDPVRRIFEWLKAEPLEGKENLEFELKKMPQGQDLIGSLDATIEGTGLKQGTVMIEFITED